jgi:hypothetical protein
MLWMGLGVVLHHEAGAMPAEQFDLPGGLRAEREEIWCHFGPQLEGDMYSLRVSNGEGESIVVAPGQARTLASYDVY